MCEGDRARAKGQNRGGEEEEEVELRVSPLSELVFSPLESCPRVFFFGASKRERERERETEEAAGSLTYTRTHKGRGRRRYSFSLFFCK